MTVSRTRDGRTLDHKTLEEMRRLAVSRVNAGESQAAVAASLQLNRTTIVRWMTAYRGGGDGALASRKSTGRPSRLTAKQQARIHTLITGKNPRQLGFGMALWSLPLVREMIRQRFDVVLHATTVARMLGRMGLTPQKPQRQAFQRDDAACLQWCQDEFPQLVAEAKRKQATMLFLDEAGIHEDGPLGTTWGERGKRPVVRATGQRRKVNVISAISPRGRLWFRCFKGMMNADAFIQFLEALIHDVRGHIVVVMDRHPAHAANATTRWLHEHRNRITVEFLPGYAPDLNPDEHVWSYLKGLFRRSPIMEGDDLDSVVTDRMTGIADDRKLVKAFFDHPAVQYVRSAFNW